MNKNNSWKIRTSGEGVVLEIRMHQDRGEGWFGIPRFLRTSFVDGPYIKYRVEIINNYQVLFISKIFQMFSEIERLKATLTKALFH